MGTVKSVLFNKNISLKAKEFLLDSSISDATHRAVTVMECQIIEKCNFTVAALRKTCGFKNYTWRKASKEMVALGILTYSDTNKGKKLIYLGIDNYQPKNTASV